MSFVYTQIVAFTKGEQGEEKRKKSSKRRETAKVFLANLMMFGDKLSLLLT